MLIDKKQYTGFEEEIEKLHGLLTDIKRENWNDHVINISDILNDEKICWDEIKYKFKKDSRKFEQVLFKIHFKRNKKLSVSQRENILTFLSIGYIYSRDVRYFNEFLHFLKKTDRNYHYWMMMLKLFFDNLTKDNYHPYPVCDINEIENFMQEMKRKVDLFRNKDMDTSQRIGLLGSPTFFKKIRNHLKSSGFNVWCYFIPFHPNKKINFLLKNRILFRLFCFVKRIDFNFIRLDFRYNDPRITNSLKTDKLDIGFHKLGFIIKKNLINAFKIGIINDHWAILPFIRGRSTIEYSVLLGIPVVATTHIVEEGVDSGDIINFYRYDNACKQYSKIRQIRNHIRREREFRAIDSIEILARSKSPIVHNRPDKGLMFYSIHPSLKKFIEKNILK